MCAKKIQNDNRRPDAIILDVDGTLWDSTGIVAEAWTRAVREMGLKDKTIMPDTLKELFGKTMDEIAEALMPDLSLDDRKILMEKCVVYEQEALENDPCKICYPGVTDTIKELSQRVPLAIVSNCQSGYIELFMKKTGLTDKEISDKECFGDSGKGKAENVVDVVKRNGFLRPYYVGDTEGDRMAIEKAGIGFIAADYGFGNISKADYRIDSFEKLLDIVG